MSKNFPLQTQAYRIALLSGVLSGTVDRPEIEHAMVVDSGRRPYRRKVVAGGKFYDSIADAARAMLKRDAHLLKQLPPGEIAKRFDANKKFITYVCDKDDTEGYYWA